MLWEWIKMQEIEIFCDGSSLGNPGHRRVCDDFTL